MKAKHFAAAMVLALAFNGGAAAAPKKAVKPIPEAFHGYWVGGRIGKKPLTEEQVAAECESLTFDRSGDLTEEEMANAPKGLDYGPLYEKNIKFSVVSMKIDEDKMAVSEANNSATEFFDWSEYPIKYSKYSPSHIQGVLFVPNDYHEDSPVTIISRREKFNYYIDDEGNLRLNNKYFKNLTLRSCDN